MVLDLLLVFNPDICENDSIQSLILLIFEQKLQGEAIHVEQISISETPSRIDQNCMITLI
jgi:hypothetical protein